ncbi:uncharacterized protein ASCRUDRAFT_77660 [Ascoidea rubescens DSM 1968]|uniref:Uncharacterized protein n=1 Tax=Ascoidea rubescens DSM 1968 TaxID=1344418 RepID=A0A1D2VB21_9ASCO|nr:hypothetical protein ASCRUDRAFT_77660 [Ascoidea rubescens DSM 1968]ODV58647.1 hypothetical protein ASCRUDRAFT_77660 [Ascoidea rubescens DSM 1968]
MKFSTTFVSAVIALLSASTSNANSADAVTAVFDDINNHLTDYLSLVTAGEVPTAILSYYYVAQSYTDDSYTTLINSDFPFSEFQTFVTGLDWYSTRLSSNLAIATGNGNAASATSATSVISSITSSASSAENSESSESSESSMSSESSESEDSSASSASSSSSSRSSSSSSSSRSSSRSSESSSEDAGALVAAPFFGSIIALAVNLL